MKKILVTGSIGLLGAALVLFLKKSGYKIVTNARAGGADFLVDLADNKKSYEMLSKIKPDLIINLASLTNVELCQEICNIAYLANARVVENLTDWIIKTRADCHLIQISTDHVYDGSELHIEEKVNLTNIYAFSKYAGELAASRVPSTILRTNFVGRSKVIHRESLSDWVYKSLINGKHIQVLDDVFFSPLSMSTLIEMIRLVVENPPIGIFNLGSRNGMSKADFAFAFANQLKIPTSTMFRIKTGEANFLKVYRPKDMRMDCSKFENALGIKLPEFSDEILRVAKEYDEAP